MSDDPYKNILDAPEQAAPNGRFQLWTLIFSVLGTLFGFLLRYLDNAYSYYVIAIGFCAFFLYCVLSFLARPKRRAIDWLYLWSIMLLLPGVYMQLFHMTYGNYFIISSLVLFVVQFIVRLISRKSRDDSDPEEA